MASDFFYRTFILLFHHGVTWACCFLYTFRPASFPTRIEQALISLLVLVKSSVLIFGRILLVFWTHCFRAFHSTRLKPTSSSSICSSMTLFSLFNVSISSSFKSSFCTTNTLTSSFILTLLPTDTPTSSST